MDAFWLWFSTGIEHITDLNGYDHILFVSLLVFTYPFKQWKPLVILISGFTLGHSVSLIASTISQIRLPQSFIEFLIALSILMSALYNLIISRKVPPTHQTKRILFLIICFFGLIHGLGFSYLLKSMLGTGQNVLLPLLYFNLGLEVGQLIIVLIVIVFSLLLTSLSKWSFNNYKLFIVCAIGLIALKICIERFMELF